MGLVDGGRDRLLVGDVTDERDVGVSGRVLEVEDGHGDSGGAELLHHGAADP